MKPSDDGSGDIIVRIWETRGSRTRGTVTLTGLLKAQQCNALEDPGTKLKISEDGTIAIELRPFEIRTLRFTKE